MDFYYHKNNYNNFFLFSRPDKALNGETAVKNYEKCKSYILENEGFAMSRFDPSRQIRVHSCFSYCTNGQDDAVLGEDRQECVDLKPSERDQILCVMPEDECEKTTVKGEVFLTAERSHKYSFSPQIALWSILIANPIQFIWDLLCIYL